MKNKIKGTVFLAIIACLLWASAFAAVKIGLQYSSPLRFAGIRFLISGLMIFPFILKIKGFWQTVTENVRLVLLVAFLQTFVHYALFYQGLNMVPGALGAIVIGAGPLFVSLTAHFMMPGDRLSLKKLAIIFLGILGITLVSLGRGSAIGVSHLLPIGILLLMLTNLNSGFVNVIVARDSGKISPLVLNSFSMIIGGLMLLVASLPIEGVKFISAPLEYYYSLAWLSFLSAAAFSIWYTLLRRKGVKVSNLNIWKFIIPVFGAILSWLLLPGESPDLLSLMGIAVTVAALLMMNFQNRKEIRERMG